MWDLFGFCYFCLNSFWSVCVCVCFLLFWGDSCDKSPSHLFTFFFIQIRRWYGYFSGERQAWKKAKALVSQRASDRTKRKGAESVEKDFAEADEDANRVFDMEDCHNWIVFDRWVLVALVFRFAVVRILPVPCCVFMQTTPRRRSTQESKCIEQTLLHSSFHGHIISSHLKWNIWSAGI